MQLDVDSVRAASERLRGLVRRTPLLYLPRATLRRAPGALAQLEGLWLKLECLQVSGSFKARGALHAALCLEPALRARGLVTASGGNHGLGVTYAAQALGVSARVFLPSNTPSDKRARLEAAGAEVEIEGAVWDEADAAARACAAAEGRAYVHPFADPAVVAGNGTPALEVLEELPDLGALVIAVGGGGLIAGSALAVTPAARVFGVEPAGAATLSASLAAGELVTLPAIETAATSLAPRRSAPLNFELIRARVEEVVALPDEELRAAARWLWEEAGVAAELGGAAGVAGLLSGAIEPGPGPVCAIVCGAGRPPA